jgi:hypothetical protein
LPKMSVARWGCAAVSIEGSVSVVGGHNLKSAEMYDPWAGQWRALPEMSVARKACAAVCIDGNLCVLGGHDGATRLASVGTCTWWADSMAQPNLRAWSATTRSPTSGARCGV